MCIRDSNTIHELTIETVDAKISDNVNIFNQLALIMEMMSGMKTEIKSENNNLKTEIKSEINASNIELKTEINKQDQKLREIDNKLEEQNKTIAGMRGEIIININNIQDEINESRTRKEKVENNTVTNAVSYTHLPLVISSL